METNSDEKQNNFSKYVNFTRSRHQIIFEASAAYCTPVPNNTSRSMISKSMWWTSSDHRPNETSATWTLAVLQIGHTLDPGFLSCWSKLKSLTREDAETIVLASGRRYIVNTNKDDSMDSTPRLNFPSMNHVIYDKGFPASFWSLLLLSNWAEIIFPCKQNLHFLLTTRTFLLEALLFLLTA